MNNKNIIYMIHITRQRDHIEMAIWLQRPFIEWWPYGAHNGRAWFQMWQKTKRTAHKVEWCEIQKYVSKENLQGAIERTGIPSSVASNLHSMEGMGGRDAYHCYRR